MTWGNLLARWLRFLWHVANWMDTMSIIWSKWKSRYQCWKYQLNLIWSRIVISGATKAIKVNSAKLKSLWVCRRGGSHISPTFLPIKLESLDIIGLRLFYKARAVNHWSGPSVNKDLLVWSIFDHKNPFWLAYNILTEEEPVTKTKQLYRDALKLNYWLFVGFCSEAWL